MGDPAQQGNCCREPKTGFFYTEGMGPFDYCCRGASEPRNRTKVSSDPDTFVMTCCLPIESSYTLGAPCTEHDDCCGGFQPNQQAHPTVCRGLHPKSRPQDKRCMYCGTNNVGAYNHC